MVNVRATDVLDLSSAQNCLSGLVTALCEGCNVRDVKSEDIHIEIRNFFESVETWEECAPFKQSITKFQTKRGILDEAFI